MAWIRTGGLADLLVGLASLVEAMALYPDARVTVVGPAPWCEILSPAQFPQVERIAVIERIGQAARVFARRGPSDGRAVGDGNGWRSTGEALPLKDIFRSCQVVVNTDIDSYRIGFTALAARVPVRHGSAPAPMAWLYNRCSPFFGEDPLVHARDAALLMLEYGSEGALKYFRTVERNRVNLPDWIGSSRLVAKWRALGLPPGKAPEPDVARRITGREPGSYLLVNPTLSQREKAWPAECFRELLLQARAPLSAEGLECLVLGSPNESDWLEEVAGDDFAIVQPPTLRELQDVMSGSRGLLTNAGSAQFIAAMTGTPVVTLMGLAAPEVSGPLGPHDQFIRGSVPPHFAGNAFTHAALANQSISVESVLASFLSLAQMPRVR